MPSPVFSACSTVSANAIVPVKTAHSWFDDENGFINCVFAGRELSNRSGVLPSGPSQGRDTGPCDIGNQVGKRSDR